MPTRKKTPAKKAPAKKKAASKRELVAPKGDKRYVRRKSDGTFGKTVDVSKSLSADKKSKAKKTVPKGQGDRGDTRKSKATGKAASKKKAKK